MSTPVLATNLPTPLIPPSTLPTAPPQPLTTAFSHLPHPLPLNQILSTAHSHSGTIDPTSHAAAIQADAKRRAEEQRSISLVNRGTGFSVAPARRRKGSVDEGMIRRSTEGEEDQTASATTSALDAEQPTSPSAVTESLFRRGSTGATISKRDKFGSSPSGKASGGSSSQGGSKRSSSTVAPITVLSLAPAIAAAAAAAAASPSPTAATSTVVPPSPSAASSPSSNITSSPTLLSNDALYILSKPSHERTEHDFDVLSTWIRLQSIEFFQEVDDATLRLLCQRMEAREYQRRELVMREGTMADALYILIAGGVSIWNESFRDHEAVDKKLESKHQQQAASARPMINTDTGDTDGTITVPLSITTEEEPPPRNLTELIRTLGWKPKHITTIFSSATSKPAFGELGLMSEQLRTATVIAEGSGVAGGMTTMNGNTTLFLLIDKQSFDSVLKRRAKDAFLEKIMVLKQLKVFSTVSERQLVKISIYFEELRFPPRTTIIQQGSIADTIYFLVEGEVEVLETIKVQGSSHTTTGTGHASHASDNYDIQQLPLGLIGAGELLSDAGVFEQPLLHPWSMVSRTPITIYAIPADEFVKRLRADVLVQVRRMAFLKKDIRMNMRQKVFLVKKHQKEIQSPKIKQAKKLLEQIHCEKPIAIPTHKPLQHGEKSSHKKAAPVITPANTAISLPRKIRQTILKNVVLGQQSCVNEGSQSARTPSDATESPLLSANPLLASSQLIGVLDEASGEVWLKGENNNSRPQTSITSGLTNGRRVMNSEEKERSVSPKKFTPRPPTSSSTTQPFVPSSPLQRPFTSPVGSKMTNSPTRSSIQFAATSAEYDSFPVMPDESRPSTVAGTSTEHKSPERGTLLMQKNPFAYDHTNFNVPSERLPSSSTDLISILTAASKASSSPIRSHSPVPPNSSMISSNAARQPYPFEHIHTGENGNGNIGSLEPPSSLPSSIAGSPRHARENSVGSTPTSGGNRHVRKTSVSLSVSPANGLIVTGLSDGMVHTIEEDAPTEAAANAKSDTPTHHRRPSKNVVMQGQIHGHRRNVSEHRGSVVQSSPMPFALDTTAPTIEITSPARPAPLSSMAAQLIAPVIILPTSQPAGSSSLINSSISVIRESEGPISPVPSFSHMPPNFYSATVPDKQYYGKMERRRPSVSFNTQSGSSATNSNATDALSPTSGNVLASGTASFQKPAASSSTLAPVSELSTGDRPNSSGTGSNTLSTKRSAMTPRLSVSVAARSDPTNHGLGATTLLSVPVPSMGFALSRSGSQASIASDGAPGELSRAPSMRDLSRQNSRRGGLMTPGSQSNSPAPSMPSTPRAGGRTGKEAQTPTANTMNRIATSAHHASSAQNHLPQPQPQQLTISNAVLPIVTDEPERSSKSNHNIKSKKPHRSSLHSDTLLASTAAALLLDPLLLQKENRKWDRQFQAWHRKLVVASSAFLRYPNGKAVDPLQDFASTGPGSGFGTSTIPTIETPILTPDNVDIFTTRLDLTERELASPLCIVPRTLPINALAIAHGKTPAIPYLYPTQRETGSMTQTRALNTALSTLQDNISVDWQKPVLSPQQQLAAKVLAHELARKKLEMEVAAKREKLMVSRMRPEDELIQRRHYIPRQLRAKLTTKQAQRRQVMFTAPAVEETAHDSTTGASGGGSASHSTSPPRRRRLKNADIGLESRKTPEQRAQERIEREIRARERAEEKMQKEEEKRLKEFAKRRQFDLMRRKKKEQEEEEASWRMEWEGKKSTESLGADIQITVEQDGEMNHVVEEKSQDTPQVVAIAPESQPNEVAVSHDAQTPPPEDSPSSTPANNNSTPTTTDPPMPLPGYTDGTQSNELVRSPEYLAISASEQEAVLLARIISQLGNEKNWLKQVIMDDGTMKRKGLLSSGVDSDSQNTTANSPSKKRDSQELIVSKSIVEPHHHKRSSLRSRSRNSNPTNFSVVVTGDEKEAPTVGEHRKSSTLTESPMSPSGSTTVRRTADERVLHSGTMELALDRELEYGIEWRYFEDRAPSKRAEEFERLFIQTGGDAASMQKALTKVAKSSQPDLHSTTGITISNNATTTTTKDQHKLMVVLDHSRRKSMNMNFDSTTILPPIVLGLEPEPVLSPTASKPTTTKQIETSPSVTTEQESKESIENVVSPPAPFSSPSIRSRSTSPSKRPLIALTQHEGEGADALLLGSSAPRLYHWSAMQSGVADQDKKSRQSSNSSPTSLEMKDLLSEDALRASLNQPIPYPPLPRSSVTRPPTLAELNSEIAVYRRDLRVLRRDLHDKRGEATVLGHALEGENSKSIGLTMQQAREQQLQRKMQRDLLGSTASPMSKILKLRKYHAGPIGASHPRLHPSGASTARPSTSIGNASDSPAAALQDDTSLEWSARRFWRQGFQKRYWTREGLREHALKLLPKEEEGEGEGEGEEVGEEEEKQSRPVPSLPVTRGTTPKFGPIPTTFSSIYQTSPTIPSLSLPSILSASASSPPTPISRPLPSPPSSSSVPQMNDHILVLKPTLSDILSRTQPPPVNILVDPVTVVSPIEEFYQFLKQHGKKQNLFHAPNSNTTGQ